MRSVYILLIAMIALVLATCGAETTTTPAVAPTEAMMDEPTAEAMMDKPTGEAMMDEPTTEAMMDEPTGEAMMDEPTAEAMMDEPTGEAMMDEPTTEAMMTEAPAWQQIALTDVRTGETFTLADFASRTVFVEPMATWCSNCRAQLGNVRDARAQLNSDDVVFIALSVETNISNADLAQYTEDTGFDWTFAVATPELLQELTNVFGRTITNPPSTPHFIIRPDGTTTELTTGIESAEQIVAQLQANS